jgi:hypothetical protein
LNSAFDSLGMMTTMLALLTSAWAFPTAPVPAGGPDAARVGEVRETFDSGGFTYVRLDTGDVDVWVAGPETRLAVGDTLATSEGALMANFHSRTLSRTFERIWFVAAWRVMGAEPSAAGQVVTPRPGTRSVSAVLAEVTQLRGAPVAVTGRVTRASEGILGRTWIHLGDGASDLTVTTTGTAKVGDVVVARGVLGTDRDFGSGYRYAVLLEDAQLEVVP